MELLNCPLVLRLNSRNNFAERKHLLDRYNSDGSQFSF